MLSVDVRKLKESVDLLFEHILDSGVDSLNLDTQYYWGVEESMQYDFLHEPKGYVVGSFLDDLDVLENVLKERGDVVAYSLAELAPLVAYVGMAAGRKLAPRGG